MTPLQKELAAQLGYYGSEVAEAHAGAVRVLEQQKYPDWRAHFAVSLREAIDLIARHRLTGDDRASSMDRKKRKAFLKRAIDPLGRQSYGMDDKYEELCATYDKLSAVIHHRRTISKEQARETLSNTENTLLLLTGSQLEINKKVEDMALKEPSADRAKKLVGIMFRKPTQEHLTDLPDSWFPYLRDAGFFSDPPGADPGWMPSRYLIKCAAKFEADVFRIIMSRKFSKVTKTRPIVYRDLLSCASRMRADRMEKIGKKAIREKWGDAMGLYLDVYWELAAKLYRKDAFDTAVKMMYFVLKPNRPHERKTGDWYRVSGVREDLLQISEKQPLPIVKLACRLLPEYVAADDQRRELGDHAHGRSAVTGLAAAFDMSVAPLIVELIENCVRHGVNDASQMAQIAEILRRGNHRIYRNLELYVYAACPDKFPKEIVTSAFLYFGDRRLLFDYCRFLGKAFDFLPEPAKRELLKKIESEPDSGRTYEDAIQKRLDLDLLKHLSASGEIDIMPDIPHDLSFAEMPAVGRFNGKSPDQVFEMADNHRIDEEVHQSGYTFMDDFVRYVQDNPRACSERARRLASSDARVQYGLIRGLWDAAGRDTDIDWDSVVALIKRMVNSPGCANPPHHAVAVCRLVDEGLKRDSTRFGLRGEMREIVRGLVDIGDQSLENCSQYRLLDASLNSVSGASFHALYQYAAWCERHDSAGKALVEDALQPFKSYLDDRSRHTATRHAVLGIRLPDFYRLDPELARAVPAQIQYDNELKIAFWDGYVSNKVRPDVFRDLVGMYDEFLNKDLIRDTDSGRPYDRTMSHVMLAYFYDLVGADRLVEEFLGKARNIAPGVRKIGAIMKNKSADPDFNRDKLTGLWSHDAFAGHDLGAWLADNPLDRKLAISLCLKHVEKREGKMDLYGYVDGLASYAEDFSEQVADCLAALIDKCDKNAVPDAVQGVLRQLLDAENRRVEAKCKLIIEKISWLGHDWSDLLERGAGE